MTTTPSTEDRIREALDRLGSTPSQIAANLRAVGITAMGPRDAVCAACPIAQYLEREVGPHPWVAPRTSYVGNPAHAVDNPEAVTRFINAVDDNRAFGRDLYHGL